MASRMERYHNHSDRSTRNRDLYKNIEDLDSYSNIEGVIEIDKTMFIIEKNNEQIYLIARPSDYRYVAIYYDSERNMLDYNKDWELWVEDGKKEPEKLTFGKILKLTGINKIPLKKV